MFEINPWNDNFNYLHLDGDERLITTRQIYCIYNDIVERLNNGLIVDVNKNQM